MINVFEIFEIKRCEDQKVLDILMGSVRSNAFNKTHDDLWSKVEQDVLLNVGNQIRFNCKNKLMYDKREK